MKAVAAFVALIATTSPALAATTIQGTTSVTTRNADPGLVVNAAPLNFGPFTLDLDPATSTASTRSVNVFRISSPEGTVNLFEDTTPYAISVAFSFANPLGTTGAPVTGVTNGVFTLFTSGFGRVTWDAPQTFSFGNGGAFSVGLRNTNFALGGGTTNVVGDFRLISDAVPAVPEPATWAMMLLGFGAVGYSMRRRRAEVRLVSAV